MRIRMNRAAWFLLVLLAVVVPFVLACGEDAAPQAEKAPAFSLVSSEGAEVSLDNLLEGRDAVVLVFYRGVF
ncbi:MAG: hypothetical protein FJ312_03250 [SAR202 cluster bacterium]|nr:hypothetical protein [SAR202 cluster bacterium]